MMTVFIKCESPRRGLLENLEWASESGCGAPIEFLQARDLARLFSGRKPLELAVGTMCDDHRTMLHVTVRCLLYFLFRAFLVVAIFRHSLILQWLNKYQYPRERYQLL